MREGGVALVSVNLEFNPLKLGAADDVNFKVGRVLTTVKNHVVC